MDKYQARTHGDRVYHSRSLCEPPADDEDADVEVVLECGADKHETSHIDWDADITSPARDGDQPNEEVQGIVAYQKRLSASNTPLFLRIHTFIIQSFKK